jgi:hypothetical protein
MPKVVPVKAIDSFGSQRWRVNPTEAGSRSGDVKFVKGVFVAEPECEPPSRLFGPVIVLLCFITTNQAYRYLP